MELKEVLLKRRSIRKFTDQKVDDSLIDELMHAAMSGPSACNKQPWEFYIIKNEEKLKEIKKATVFTKFDAPLAIVVCGNLKKALPLQLSSFWIQDCSAATQNILLRVTDLGLGAVWCGLHPQKRAEQRVQKLLELEDTIIPLALLFIGYPNEEQPPRDQYNEKKIHII